MANSLAQHKRDFKRIIERACDSRHLHQVFLDWSHIAACTVHNSPYHLYNLTRDDAFNQVEAEYMEAIKKYTRPQLDSFAQLLGITYLALDDKTDFLSDVYQELELANKDRGQFFTPFNLSLLIAKMTLIDACPGGIDTIIQRQGFVTLHEPASGAGGMIIAAAQVLEDAGYNPSSQMFVVAQDISAAAFHMTFLQTSILGLSALVRHGDTLAHKFHAHWFTPACRLHPRRTNTFLDALRGEPTDMPASETGINQPAAPAPAQSLNAQLALLPDLILSKPSRRAKAAPGGGLPDAPTSTESSFVQSTLF